MKICEKCGAYNADERFFCVDCHERLGDKLSASSEGKVADLISDSIDDLYNKKDPLYVSKCDKIIGTASLVGILCSVILLAIGGVRHLDVTMLWVGILFFALASIESLVPKVSWFLEQLRLSFYINGAEDAQPSDFYLKLRKFTVLVSAIVGAVILVLTFCHIF